MISILIIDDDKYLAELLADELKELGFKSEFVNSASEGISQLSQENDYDIVLLDLKMPEHDGFWVLEKMREIDCKQKVIVVTAYADLDSALKSSKLGASGFVSKPYDLDDLLITIRSVLQEI